MSNIKIKDMELLEKKQQEIIDLYKIINESHESRKLKKIQYEIEELKKKIIKYSTYNSIQIGNILAKLMTNFEGIPYSCIKNNVYFQDCDYSIEPSLFNINLDSVYSKYQMKNLRKNKSIFDSEDLTKLCLLPPSKFKNKTDILYIQMFIDYLYERRTSKIIEDITDDILDEILLEFLEITKELQEQRKNQIKIEIENIRERKERIEFEKACLIDRKLIYNSLSHIINYYEDNMTCKKVIIEEGYYIYHRLIIVYDDKELTYSSVIYHDDDYEPDEMYCNINSNNNTNICFFDIKDHILPVIRNSQYIKKFIDMIEQIYNIKSIITVDDIHEILVIISNERTSKKRMLKKEFK